MSPKSLFIGFIHIFRYFCIIIVFKDPSVYEKGPSLIEKDALLQYLEEKNLQIIWLVAGEKQVFSDFNLLFGSCTIAGLYEWSNNDVAGSIWSKRLNI